MLNSRKLVILLMTALISCLGDVSFAQALPRIENLRGSAAIRSAQNGAYRRAAVGDRIGIGEALLPSPLSRVLVRCPNNTRRRATPGRLSGVTLICPDVTVTQRSRDESVLLILNAGRFPYVENVIELSEFQWPTLPGTERYHASLYRLEQDSPVEQIWEIETVDTSVIYDGPTLDSDTIYSLVVESSNDEKTETTCGFGRAESDDVTRSRKGLCYRLSLQKLPTVEVERLDESIAATNSSGLDEITQTLANAYRYSEANAYSEVVRLLLPLLENDEQIAALHQLLADSYLHLGWIEEAKAEYEVLESLAFSTGDYTSRLDARVGLANIAAWQMQPDLSVDYLWLALWDASYERDRARADNIVQWLIKLE